MTRAKLLVFTSPVSPDVSVEFDSWYDHAHIPQVVATIPGIVSGQRYVKSASSPGSDGAVGTRRMAIYDIESDDVSDTVNALFAAMGDGTLDQTPLMDRTSEPPEVLVYEAN